jgi:hypothetical protein
MMSHILLNNRKKTKAPLTKEMFHIRPMAKLSKRFEQVLIEARREDAKKFWKVRRCRVKGIV